MKVAEQQVFAYVLHVKAYQETSQIIQLFSLEQGRFSVIAKGIKSKRSQARKAILQPFFLLNIEFTGKSELKTLLHCEKIAEPGLLFNKGLTGKPLACAYYATELLLRGLPEKQTSPELFESYRHLIEQVAELKPVQIPPLLRRFEVTLLNTIGIAPDWNFDVDQNPICADKRYLLVHQTGFKLTDSLNQHESFTGQSILSLVSGKFDSKNIKSSQKITNLLLKEVIGNKPLHSRKLWQHMSLNQS